MVCRCWVGGWWGGGGCHLWSFTCLLVLWLLPVMVTNATDVCEAFTRQTVCHFTCTWRTYYVHDVCISTKYLLSFSTYRGMRLWLYTRPGHKYCLTPLFDHHRHFISNCMNAWIACWWAGAGSVHGIKMATWSTFKQAYMHRLSCQQQKHLMTCDHGELHILQHAAHHFHYAGFPETTIHHTLLPFSQPSYQPCTSPMHISFHITFFSILAELHSRKFVNPIQQHSIWSWTVCQNGGSLYEGQ